MTLLNYTMKVFNTILFGLVFGVGLFLACESVKTLDTSRECTIERYKVNSTDKAHGLYVYLTTSDNELCYSGWVEIAVAHTYRDISHIFDRFIETRPIGSKIKCYKKYESIPEFNTVQLGIGLMMIIGSLFITRST